MRKTLKVTLFLCTILLVSALLFTSCDKADNTQSPNVTTNETTDGTTESETTPHTHYFGKWKITKEATCKEIGIQERVCVCGEKETQTIDKVTEHIYGKVTMENYIVSTCKIEGSFDQVVYCSVCDIELIRTSNTIPKKTKHTNGTAVVENKVNSTCTADGSYDSVIYCSVCNCEVSRETKTINANGHTIVTDYAVKAIGDRNGLTEGSHCSSCGTILVPQQSILAPGYSNPSLYQDDYGYTYLATEEKGSAMQLLYNEIDAVARVFHNDSTINAIENVVGTFDYGSKGLTENEAIAVWKCYKNDHPLYYWISTSLMISGPELILLTEDEYANGENRAVLNQLVYNGVKIYVDQILDETSEYQIALAFHDAIILAIDYAYESDGYTPQDDVWAHSILGVFEKQSGVCESYSRTFQLLLNYCDVENIYVTGISNDENHGWNLAQMDDGNWYWFDLTWDDVPRTMWGISYNYFCVNDTQSVKWVEAGWETPYANFLDHHKIDLPTDEGVHFLYSLPTRSTSVFDNTEPRLLDVFEVDGLVYGVVGYNKVQLIGISKDGTIVIPETIEYQGSIYEVISIGGCNLDSSNRIYYIQGGTVYTESSPTSITIPSTVKFVWDQALLLPSLENIFVSEDNPYFSSKDGVLFTKSLYTLIQYPLANPRQEYTIPNETVDIACRAFGYKYYGLKNLSKLTLGVNVHILGKNNWGYGYFDCNRSGNGLIIDWAGMTIGAWVEIYDSLRGKKEIIIPNENPHFYRDEIAIYEYGGEYGGYICVITDPTITTLHISANISDFDAPNLLNSLPNLESITLDPDNPYLLVQDNILYKKLESELKIIGVLKNITGHVSLAEGIKHISAKFSNCTSLISISIPNSVTSIDDCAFCNCTSLTSITIGNSVTSIGYDAFHGCTSLTSIAIPNSVTNIGERAFLGCTSLTSIAIPNSITSINSAAFNACSSLTSIIIPDSVTNIGDAAFLCCTSLASVYYVGSVHDWTEINISHSNSELTSATRYYYSETQPTDTANNYWHYVNGVPTAW